MYFNSPVPSHTSYKLQLIDKIERYQTYVLQSTFFHFFLHDNEKNKGEAKRQTLGFKSKHHPC